jgi:hypothetical protein
MKTRSQEKIVLYTLMLVLSIAMVLVAYMHNNFRASDIVDSSGIQELLNQTQKVQTAVEVNFSHAIQLGAFTTESAAQTFLKQMTMVGVKDPYVLKRSNPVRFVVAVGKFNDVNEARLLRDELQKNDIEGFVIHL